MFVVRHTDNVGYDYNMGLSQRRAAAVVKEQKVNRSPPCPRHCVVFDNPKFDHQSIGNLDESDRTLI
jgi:hypothetical protein